MLTEDGAINHNGSQFEGMMRYDARIAVEEALKEKVGPFRAPRWISFLPVSCFNLTSRNVGNRVCSKERNPTKCVLDCALAVAIFLNQ